MKLFRFNPNKSKAQAMVEFAIALPVLLLILYGILETGRYLFLYSTVVTASRQAARYGTATGQGLTTTLPRYQDCAGMRTAANNAGYIGTFDSILLQYDSGPADTTPTTYCTGTTDTTLTSAYLSTNNRRIKVTVSKVFRPIVPRLVPFVQRTITATSARTVILSVSIEVTPPFTPTYTFTPSFTPSNTPTASITPTITRTPTITPTLQFTYTPSRTPTATTSPTITRTPTISPVPPTSVPGCTNSALTLGLLTKSGNTMSLTVTNNLTSPLQIANIDVVWNNDKGHLTGGDKTLELQSAVLGIVIWNGNQLGPSHLFVPTSPAIFPALSTTTLSFNFHQSYDNWDNPSTESVTINLSTPGCEGTVFSQTVHN